MFDLALLLADLRIGHADPLRYRLGLQSCASADCTCAFACCQSGRGGVDLLLGGRLPWQAALALIIGLRLDLGSLRRGELGLRLFQQCGKILAGDLGTVSQTGELAFRRIQHALSIALVVHILPRIDMDQRLSFVDELIVGHIERHDLARDLRRDAHGAPVDKGVVR